MHAYALADALNQRFDGSIHFTELCANDAAASGKFFVRLDFHSSATGNSSQLIGSFSQCRFIKGMNDNND